MNIDFFEVGKCYRDKEEGTFIYMRVDVRDDDLIFGSAVEMWSNMVSIKEDYPLNYYMDAEDVEEITHKAFNEAVEIAMYAMKDTVNKIKNKKYENN